MARLAVERAGGHDRAFEGQHLEQVPPQRRRHVAGNPGFGTADPRELAAMAHGRLQATPAELEHF